MDREQLRRKVKREALAYRVWGYATPKGWDVSLQELADALGVGAHTVGRIVKRKGWTNRIRSHRRYGVDMHHGWAETRTNLGDIEELKL